MLHARVRSTSEPVVKTPSESQPTPTLVLALYICVLAVPPPPLATKPVAPSP
jgi:hypothetical protein